MRFYTLEFQSTCNTSFWVREEFAVHFIAPGSLFTIQVGSWRSMYCKNRSHSIYRRTGSSSLRQARQGTPAGARTLAYKAHCVHNITLISSTSLFSFFFNSWTCRCWCPCCRRPDRCHSPACWRGRPSPRPWGPPRPPGAGSRSSGTGWCRSWCTGGPRTRSNRRETTCTTHL